MRTHLGPYRIEAPLGRGGMGVVYRGVHEHLGRPVAVKALAPELTQQPEFKERFFAEAKTQARLQHPNVVGVYDLLEDAGEFFIVMEFVDGEGLDDKLARSAGRAMDLGEAMEIASQVLAGLDHAHSEGVIHRDVKPSNVLVTASGRVKLTDFGIALLIGDKRLTASQSAIGTPTYMSPEQIVRPRSVDHRTDIYSAAVVLYEMLAGRPPFDDETEFGIKKLHVEAPPPDLAQLRPDLPPAMVSAVETALRKEPDDRFASAGLFLAALREGSPAFAVPSRPPATVAPFYQPTGFEPPGAGSAPAAPPLPPPRAAREGDTPPGKGRRVALMAAAAVLAIAAALSAVLLFRGPREASVAAGVSAEGRAPLPAGQPASGPPATGGVPLAAVEPAAPNDLAAPAPQGPPPASRLPAVVAEPRREPAPPRPAAERNPEPSPAVAETPAGAATADLEPDTDSPEPPQAEPSAEPEAPTPPSADEPRREAAAGVDNFSEMKTLTENVAQLSEQALEAHEAESGEGELYSRLEEFSEAAIEVRRAFKRTTGTGVLASARKLVRRNETDDAAAKDLRIKIEGLARRAETIDGLIGSAGSSPRSYWQEIRGYLTRLREIS